jgi:hypothetical protein
LATTLPFAAPSKKYLADKYLSCRFCAIKPSIKWLDSPSAYSGFNASKYTSKIPVVIVKKQYKNKKNLDAKLALMKFVIFQQNQKYP